MSLNLVIKYLAEVTVRESFCSSCARHEIRSIKACLISTRLLKVAIPLKAKENVVL